MIPFERETNIEVNTSSQQIEYFDTAASDRERLDARLGGQPWTERAAARDESLRREVSAEIKKHLGDRAADNVKPR